MTRPIAALACVALVTVPGTGFAAEPSTSERAAIERSQRIGTGLLWGGVAAAGVGGLTLLGGIIPTQRNLRTAEARRSLCELACSEHDAEIDRWTRARNGVAVAGSILAAGGLALVAVGVSKRRKARRDLEALEKRTAPEWSIRPSVGPLGGGVTLVARF